jgi:hypothetical protein
MQMGGAFQYALLMTSTFNSASTQETVPLKQF